MGRKRKGDMSPNKIRVSYTFDVGLVERILSEADAKNKPVSQVVEDILKNHYTKEQVQREPGIGTYELLDLKDMKKSTRKLLRRTNEPTVAPEIQTH